MGFLLFGVSFFSLLLLLVKRPIKKDFSKRKSLNFEGAGVIFSTFFLLFFYFFTTFVLLCSTFFLLFGHGCTPAPLFLRGFLFPPFLQTLLYPSQFTPLFPPPKIFMSRPKVMEIAYSTDGHAPNYLCPSCAARSCFSRARHSAPHPAYAQPSCLTLPIETLNKSCTLWIKGYCPTLLRLQNPKRFIPGAEWEKHGPKTVVRALTAPCVCISWTSFRHHFIPLLIDTASGNVVFADSLFESSNSRSAKLLEITTLLSRTLHRTFTISKCEIPKLTEYECGICTIRQCLVWLNLPSFRFDTFTRAECAGLYEQALGIKGPLSKKAKVQQTNKDQKRDNLGKKQRRQPKRPLAKAPPLSCLFGGSVCGSLR